MYSFRAVIVPLFDRIWHLLLPSLSGGLTLLFSAWHCLDFSKSSEAFQPHSFKRNTLKFLISCLLYWHISIYKAAWAKSTTMFCKEKSVSVAVKKHRLIFLMYSIDLSLLYGVTRSWGFAPLDLVKGRRKKQIMSYAHAIWSKMFS